MAKKELTLAGAEALETILANGGVWTAQLSLGKKRPGSIHPKTIDHLLALDLVEIVRMKGPPRGIDYPAPRPRAKGEHIIKHMRRQNSHARAMQVDGTDYIQPTAKGLKLLNAARAYAGKI